MDTLFFRVSSFVGFIGVGVGLAQITTSIFFMFPGVRLLATFVFVVGLFVLAAMGVHAYLKGPEGTGDLVEVSLLAIFVLIAVVFGVIVCVS